MSVVVMACSPRLITQKRPDIDVKGIEVFVRDQTYIPVDPFDGRIFPQ